MGIVTDLAAVEETSVVVNDSRLTTWLGVNLPAKAAHQALSILSLCSSQSVALFEEETSTTKQSIGEMSQQIFIAHPRQDGPGFALMSPASKRRPCRCSMDI